MSRVGARLHRLASRFCSRTTMERLVEPMLADMRHEHEQAVARGGQWRGWRVRAAGYLAFWRALLVHAVATTPQGALDLAAANDWLVARLARMAVAVFLVATIVMVLPPVLAAYAFGGASIGLLAVYLAPQGMFLAIPIALSMAIAYGCRGRHPSRRILAAVLAFAICGTAAAFATREWLIPDANQAFRATFAPDGVLLRGPGELSLRELGAHIDRLRIESAVMEATKMSRVYHLHWALSFASIALGIVSLGASSVSTRRSVAVVVGLVVPVAYWACLWTMEAVVLDTSVHPAIVWLPNVLFVACGVALLGVRHASRRPGPIAG